MLNLISKTFNVVRKIEIFKRMKVSKSVELAYEDAKKQVDDFRILLESN